jgi:hypothetical protein
VSMGVYSDGSYDAPKGVVYSFPVTCKHGKWSIVQVRLCRPSAAGASPPPFLPPPPKRLPGVGPPSPRCCLAALCVECIPVLCQLAVRQLA